MATAICGLGCGGGGGEPGVVERPPASSAAGGAPLVAEAEASLATRIELGDARRVPSATRIETVDGDDSILFLSTAADQPLTWAARLDAQQRLGPVITLPGAWVARAIAWRDGSTTLITTERGELCLARLERGADTASSRRCHASAPAAISKLGEQVAFLFVRAPPEPDDAREGGETDRPRAKGKRPVKGSKPSASAVLEVALRLFEPDGEPTPLAEEDDDDPYRSTELSFVPPMLGMGLIDARSRGDGIDLLFYEDVPSEEILPRSERGKKRPKGVLGRARVAAARLGGDGLVVEGSRREVVQGDLEFGLIPTHQRPRLATRTEGSAYVGQQGLRGPCLARRVSPKLGPSSNDRVVCAIDPGRFALPDPVSSDEQAQLQAMFDLDPRRIWGQPGHDAGLVSWGGDRAFFFRGVEIWSATPGRAAARFEPAPLLAKRSRVAWGSIGPDGEGVALTESGVMHLDGRGGVQTRAAAWLSPGVSAPLESADRRVVARIGSTWWLARGALRPIDERGETTAGATLHPDAHRLVGGRDAGWLFEARAGALFARTLASDGSLGVETRLPHSVQPGYDATERRGGGAIVASVTTSAPGRIVAFVVRADGSVGAPEPTTLASEPGAFGVRLSPLPGGGALLTDLARSQVAWLDDEGRELARAAWPGDESALPCIDGWPQRAVVPAPTPGRFVSVAPLATGSCVMGELAWTHGGALRWLGTRTRGADIVAEAVTVPFEEGSGGVPLEGPPPPTTSAGPLPGASAAAPAAARCPPDMVDVGGLFCIDRFEAHIVDTTSGRALSTDYPATPNLAGIALDGWASQGAFTGGAAARAMPVPMLPEWQRGQSLDVLAASRGGVRPNGYLTGLVAESACERAGKRLCTPHEFVKACRGEDDTLFPYGPVYVHGICNVFRSVHPAAVLHDNPSIGHLDPRLNRVREGDRPLLLATGSLPACRSRWGADAVYDLVGNLDEWVDEKGGAFAGGFYARSTRAGCEAKVDSHPRAYLDYSTGVRCCRDAEPSPTSPADVKLP